MPNLSVSDLRDPSPPMPGDAERSAVARRANQLGRRRRMMQGAGALGMVAAVAVGVAALTAGGTSSGPGRIATASPAGATPVTTAAASGPATSTSGGTSGYTVSSVVANIPPGVRLTVTLAGAGGTFTGVADAGGRISIDGLPAGDYSVAYEWVSTEGTATRVGKLGSVTVAGDSTVALALP